MYAGLDEAAAALQGGAVGVIPTDTVYGLACSASDQDAVKRLYGLKKREAKPGTVIAASTDQLIRLGIKESYLKPVAHYWPNPISMVIPNHELAYLHLGAGGIAVRIPNHPALTRLLEITGPLLTSSANQPGEPEARTVDEAKAYFNEGVDFYVDGGDLSARKASTVIRIVDDAVEVLREGSVKIDEAGRILP